MCVFIDFKKGYIMIRTIENKRLRNLTTGYLHTSLGDIYQDIEFFIGEAGIMTHQLPNASEALMPFLKDIIEDESLWVGGYLPDATGSTEVRAMNEFESVAFWDRYKSLLGPFEKLGSKS